MTKALHHIAGQVYQDLGKDILIFDPVYLQKTLARRLAFLELSDTGAYLELLESTPSETGLFLDALSNSYTTFFRNPLTFAYLEQVIFPALITGKGPLIGSIRIWSAGCAMGQEAYSLAMLLDEACARSGASFTFQIFATDNSRQALEFARKGRYDAAALDNVRMGQRDAYFVQRGDAYETTDRLNAHIEFSYYDILDTQSVCPPACIFGDLDIIFCSNVLFYYRQDMRQAIISKLHRSLSTRGYLVTDQTEREDILGSGLFRPTSPYFPIYSPIIHREI
jgi:chemotaxis methyl-accepting protein methylase